MNKLILLIISFLASGDLYTQPAGSPATNKSNAQKGVTSAIQMPYNRLVQSAGKVITFGDPELENHALDIIAFNDKKALAVEHRYGLAIINPASNQIQTRWSFTDSANYKDLVSTYSGITSVVYQGTTYIIWGAQGGRADRGFVVIA